MRLSMKRKGTDFGGKKGIWEIKDRMHADKNTKIEVKEQNYWKKRTFFNNFLEVTDFFIIFAARNFHSL